MSTFTEDLHPRGQAANAGQFRAKENTAPAGSLEPHTQEPTPETPASVAEWHALLADVNTMGGDEIRALDDATLTRLDAYLLQGAQRVQAAFAERGLRHETDAPAGVDKLEVVDYRNVTEAQVAHAFIAGTGQGVVGGIIRSKDDFYNHAMDEHGEDDEALVDRAWEKFSTGYGLQLHDVDAPWAADEYQAWTTSVADALAEARNG